MAYSGQHSKKHDHSMIMSQCGVDGIEVKISDDFLPPKKISLPLNYETGNPAEVLFMEYDFSLEEKVLAWSEAQERAREALLKAQEEEKQRLIDIEERAREALLLKAQEEERQRLQEIEERFRSENTDGGTDTGTTNKQTVTNEDENSALEQENEVHSEVVTNGDISTVNGNVKVVETVDEESVPEKSERGGAQSKKPLSVMHRTDNGILVPTPIVKWSKPTDSAKEGQDHTCIDLKDFENEQDPFDNLELKTLNDMEELNKVLQGSQPTSQASSSSSSQSQPHPSQPTQGQQSSVVTQNVIGSTQGQNINHGNYVNHNGHQGNSGYQSQNAFQTGQYTQQVQPAQQPQSNVYTSLKDVDYPSIESYGSSPNSAISLSTATSSVQYKSSSAAQGMATNNAAARYQQQPPQSIPPQPPQSSSAAATQGSTSSHTFINSSLPAAIQNPQYPYHQPASSQQQQQFSQQHSQQQNNPFQTQSANVAVNNPNPNPAGSQSNTQPPGLSSASLSSSSSNPFHNLPDYSNMLKEYYSKSANVSKTSGVGYGSPYSRHSVDARAGGLEAGAGLGQTQQRDFMYSYAPSAGGLRSARSTPDISALVNSEDGDERRVGLAKPTSHTPPPYPRIRTPPPRPSSHQDWNPYNPLPPTQSRTPPPSASLNTSFHSDSDSPGRQTQTRQAEVLPDPYKRLCREAQQFIDNITDMGFPRARVARAVEKLGQDDKKVIDFLCLVNRLCEQKYDPNDVESAMHLFTSKQDKVEMYLKLLQQFRELGFKEDTIKDTLLSCDLDEEKTLDTLTAT